MIQTNANWDVANAGLAKRPIYVFAIDGQAQVYSTHDLTAEGITGAPAFKAWLKTPRGASQSIDILRGSSSIGELECEVIDQAGAVRQLVGGTTLEGQSATLSVGYPGLAYADFITLHSYTLYKITPSRHYTSWVFRSRDRQMSAKRTIWSHPENGLPIEESNPWVLCGTPAEIVQAIYLFALGRDASEVDREGMEALDSGIEGLYKTVRPFLFILNEPFEAKQFIESEICKVAGLYPIVDNIGRIGLKAFRAPAAGPSAVYTFDADNMIVLPEIDRKEIVNEILFKIDYDGSGFANELLYVDATSVSTYGRASQLSIESKGLRTVFGAQWWCQEMADRMFARFSGIGLRGGAPVANIEAFLLTAPVWVGDYVNLTHPLMPDLLTGALGVEDRLYEVIDREPDYARGRMRYKLLDTGLTGKAGAFKFTPSDNDCIIGTGTVY
jgi:hypothetical protein